jgi:hypothetical protein
MEGRGRRPAVSPACSVRAPAPGPKTPPRWVLAGQAWASAGRAGPDVVGPVPGPRRAASRAGRAARAGERPFGLFLWDRGNYVAAPALSAKTVASAGRKAVRQGARQFALVVEPARRAQASHRVWTRRGPGSAEPGTAGRVSVCFYLGDQVRVDQVRAIAGKQFLQRFRNVAVQWCKVAGVDRAKLDATLRRHPPPALHPLVPPPPATPTTPANRRGDGPEGAVNTA